MLREQITKPKARCIECRGELVFAADSGEQVCSSCGCVNENADNASLYSREYFSSASHSVRREEPTSGMMYDLNLPTVIDRNNFDANGKQIQATFELNLLRRLNNAMWSDSKRSNESKAMKEIERVVGVLALPDSVGREACDIYHKGLNDGVIRGRSISNMAAAAVLIACKIVGVSCTSEEIEEAISTANGKAIRRYYKLLLRHMNIRLNDSSPSLDVSRIASKVGLSGKIERRALEILSLVEKNPIFAGKRPVSLAAAALYLASIEMHERTNQLRVAFAAGVTPITIRKRSSEIAEILSSMGKSA